ncbi:MAG: 1-deoxy-D-xylulose-5-phosphate reductoisomerase [Betaproteobacteria bacterium]|nr:1-deoxy-D-xylulose-5-phosphate reductoisomerase [Betaproteobacteria bacterium]
MKNITILGSTGSIGVNTLDVIARHPDRFQVFALSAASRVEELAKQCQQFRPRFAAVPDPKLAETLRTRLAFLNVATEVVFGEDALPMVASHADTHMVMAAIVGAAGLPSSLAAAKAGKTVLLANKEALVMAGNIFMETVRENGASLLPIDSEHNAIFQSLPSDFSDGLSRAGVRKVILTASGGPFRTRNMAELAGVTPDQACAHPNWVMGRKISVDSATMMNKGLEVIEAHWLFDAAPEQIEVLIHPQSIVHSMVEYLDGSVLAQMGNPDMRTPIAYALGFPERIAAGVSPLDLAKAGRLEFEALNLDRFPCVRLAYEALRRGGTAPAVLNAANEKAVDAFLNGQLAFLDIPRVIEDVLGAARIVDATTLADVLIADTAARIAAIERIAHLRLKDETAELSRT